MTTAGGARAPAYTVVDLPLGPLADGILLSPRLGPIDLRAIAMHWWRRRSGLARAGESLFQLDANVVRRRLS